MKQIGIYLKSVLLLLLIGASVVQTTTLWFDEMSDRNVFYRAVNQYRSLVAKEETASMIQPERLAVFFGEKDREYTVIREEAVPVDRLLAAIYTMLADGLPQAQKYTSAAEVSSIWERSHVSMTLTTPLGVDHFAASLGVRNADIGFKGQVGEVLVQPASATEENLVLFLLEETTGEYYRYNLGKALMGDANDLVLKFIDDRENVGTVPAYISTWKDGFEIFSSNVLLPLPTGALTYYGEIYLYTPYLADGRIVTGIQEETTNISLEGHVSRFFDNPDIKTVTRKEDSVLYGDGEVTVSYNEEGFLEMKKVVTKRRLPDVFQAFAQADAMVERDMKESLIDYAFEGYSTTADSVVFNYTYKVDGYPVYLDNQILEEVGLDYPIQVEVTDGTVSRYRRFVVQREETLIQPTAFEGRYQDALDTALAQADGAGSSVANMELVYAATAPGALTMEWLVELDGRQVFVPVSLQGGGGQ